jgi:hypothetical protein
VHPILQSIRRLLLYLGSCSLVAGLLAVVYASVSGAPLEEAASVVIPLALVYAFMCLSAWYVCLATPLDARNWARVLYAQTGSAALAVAIWAVFWEGWTRLLLPIFDQSVSHYREQSVLIVATGVLLFWLASMFHYLLIALEESRRRETRELGLVSHPQHRPAGHTGALREGQLRGDPEGRHAAGGEPVRICAAERAHLRGRSRACSGQNLHRARASTAPR